MILAWLLVAAALVLVPGPVRRAARAGSHPVGPLPAASDAPPDAALPRGLLLAATAGLGAASVAVLGPVAGSVVAAVLCPAAGLALGRVRSRPASTADPGVPLVLDLTAAALRAGRPPADALAAAAPAAGPTVRAAFARVAGLLRLGAGPDQAWAVLAGHGPLAPVAAVAVRSAASGARLATAFERLADELRAEAAAAAAARAQRCGVVALAPLGLCFLPAFVLLGVVPVVVGVARTALGGVA